MARIGHPHRRQLAGPEQSRQTFGVAPIGLDPIAGLLRYERWCRNDAAMAEALDVPVQTVPGRASLVAESQSAILARQRGNQLLRRGLTRVNLAEIANFAIAGNGHRIAQLRCIDPNENFVMICQGSPSLCEALPGPSGQPSNTHRG
jgi:hypothetical protein